MSPPVQPIPSGDQIMANVSALRSQGASDNDIEAYLKQSGLAPDAAPVSSPALDRLHAAYRSGALARQTAAANAADAQDAQGPGYLSRFATHVLNAAQGIPGMEAVEAGAGALGSHLTGHPLTYAQSLSTLRDATGNISGPVSFAEKLMGSAATLPFLPANPAMAGAVIGGADQALSADPDQSLLARGAKTAAGAGAGYLGGKLLDQLYTAGRSALGNTSASNVIQREASRSLSASKTYAKALAEGQGATNTPAIQAILKRPDVAEIADGLLQTQQFQGKQAHDPELLDAIYKTLSDRSGQIKRGLDALTPNRPNIGRYALNEIKATQNDLLDAMSGGANAPMPSYRQAVQDFADASRGINAVQRGSSMVKGSNVSLKAAKNLSKTSPEAFAAWAAKATPAERQAATEGILGGLKSVDKIRAAKVLGVPMFPMATKAAAAAPGLLRTVDPNASLVPTLGILAGHSLY